jgi:hypothetical protein
MLVRRFPALTSHVEVVDHRLRRHLREGVCVCVCVREGGRESVCVRVCARETAAEAETLGWYLLRPL